MIVAMGVDLGDELKILAGADGILIYVKLATS